MSANYQNTPSMRCPGCGQGVTLPAEVCPSCGFNFRTGQKPPQPGQGPGGQFRGSSQAASLGPDKGSGPSKLVLLAGGAALVIVLALVLFFVAGGDDPEDLPVPAPGGGGGLSAPMTVEEIRTQSPTLNPARTINRARGVSDVAEQRNEELKEIGQELNE